MKVISGGQTGVDRAALDAAAAVTIPCGGWCPRGRRAEDGPIDKRYSLVETDSQDYSVRTEKNILESDGTLLFYSEAKSGGTKLTGKLARRHSKPILEFDLQQVVEVKVFLHWLEQHQIQILNVAGPRESNVPGIYQQAFEILRVFFEGWRHSKK